MIRVRPGGCIYGPGSDIPKLSAISISCLGDQMSIKWVILDVMGVIFEVGDK